MKLRPDRRETRRAQALARNTTWAEKPVVSKIRLLDLRLGPGRGAVRQRKRLLGA